MKKTKNQLIGILLIASIVISICFVNNINIIDGYESTTKITYWDILFHGSDVVGKTFGKPSELYPDLKDEISFRKNDVGMIVYEESTISPTSSGYPRRYVGLSEDFTFVYVMEGLSFFFVLFLGLLYINGEHQRFYAWVKK